MTFLRAPTVWKAAPRVRARTPRWLARLGRSFSIAGLLTATLFFAASLTPSLIPRTYPTQGVLSGLSLAAGYGVGTLALWTWRYLELPLPRGGVERIVKLAAAAACAGVAVAFLLQASAWQNSIRMLMELEPVDSAQPFRVAGVALLVFAAVIILARLFRLVLRLFAGYLRRHAPHRLANVLGTAAAVALFWALVDGVLLEFGLRAADESFRQLDALDEPGINAPSNPVKTGSPQSLIAWDDLGRLGRRYILSGPTRVRLDAYHGDGTSMEPVRVYVGLNAADTAEVRAELALEELKRVDAFERSVLVVITPPGTGWIDGAAIDTVEYLHRGDIASVAVQYSYLPSWLSLLVQPDYGAETARALFKKVYEHWTQLPADDRPRLYLHGVSLGALNSDLSADLFDFVGDPIQGALWSGPPFNSPTWNSATRERIRGSPAWRPIFREGSVIRFMNQEYPAEYPYAYAYEEWGPVRIVYLQYASDPVTFFEPRALYREPEWMRHPRGPDVSPELRWYPIVTLIQLTVDLLAADTSPTGYGHDYAAVDYIDAWVAVTEPEGWTDDEIDALKRFFSGG